MTTVRREKTSTGPVTIKKYANRRLYNTATSSYVTLDHLADMVRDDVDFVVYDAKTGEDITRSVLTQIIFEAEGKGQNMLPVSFLRQLISFYGDSLQNLVPSYLDLTMDAFTSNRDEMKRRFGSAIEAPMKQFEEATRRNMQLFEQAMSVFNPFMAGAQPPSRPAEPARDAPAEKTGGDEISQLKGQLDEVQRQLEQLMKRQG
ncbi:MAG: polyhydroxyalkanoate synthesis repressor PhaR [Pseudomonadota bacterium]|nr:polyhydroxyalkanoate synthesis repressor PhaR [Pseudomonadota bacterium]